MNKKIIRDILEENSFVGVNDIRCLNEQGIENVIKELSNSHKLLVTDKVIEIKQKIIEHFISENTLLDNIKESMSEDEYTYRKKGIKRQTFYIKLIFSSFQRPNT